MRDLFAHNTANEKKWSQRSLTFDELRYGYFRILQRMLIALAQIQPQASFLDLGCGTGWAVRHAARLCGGKGRFIGVDLSHGMITRARRNSYGNPRVEFCQASAEGLPFESEIFYTIICSNSFHHYYWPEAALTEIKRVLKPHGRIYILDVTSDDPFVRWIDQRTREREKEHVRYYSTGEYVRMFSRVGLKHIHSHPLNIMYPLKVHVAEKEAHDQPPVP